VASECAKEALVKKGVSEGKIKVFGLPVDQKFSMKLDKIKTARELNVSIDRPSVLIMGGSRGFGPIKSIIKSLEKSTIDANFLVVAGSNKSLFKWLKKKRLSSRMHAYPLIDYVDKLMAVSEIIITKPGGITTAESIAKSLPMLIINPIPGQEENNTNYLLREGVAVKADTIDDAVSKLNELLNDKSKLSSIREKMSKLSKPLSSVKIAELALSAV
ncbi:MAG: glycosyltransferase, partial [Bacteroidota bacterium]